LAAAGLENEVCSFLISQGADCMAEDELSHPVAVLSVVKLISALRLGKTPLEISMFAPNAILRGQGLKPALARTMDCFLLLEAYGSHFDDLGERTVWTSIIIDELAECVKTSQDIQNVKVWLSFMQKRAWHLNLQTRDGKTPLMMATMLSTKPLPTIRLMLACGADVSLKDDAGLQVLHHALLGRPGCGSEFVDGGEAVDPDSYESMVGLVTCLIEAGADIFALDNVGITPMVVAKMCGTSLAFADALERCGLSVDDTWEASMRRQAQWEADRRRLYGAKRTAVDVEDLETPSTDGLRKRRRHNLQSGDDD
jgi:Ankyrin repeat